MAEPAYISNNPPDDQAILIENLTEKHYPLIQRADQLLAAEARTPEPVDDVTAGKISDYIKLVAAAIKSSEAARTEAKEPHLAAGRTVDSFFKAHISEPLAAVKQRTERKLTVYLQTKEAERRRAAEEEAKRLRIEAEERAKAAAAAETASQPHAAATAMDSAVAHEQAAAQADIQAHAKPAELSRTRGEVGSVASLRQVWKGEIEARAELDLEALRPYLPVAALETAINGFVKAGGRTLKGARIYQTTSATVR